MKIAFSFFLSIYSRCGVLASWATRPTTVCLDDLNQRHKLHEIPIDLSLSRISLCGTSVVPILSAGTKIIPVSALFIPVPVLELELELEQ